MTRKILRIICASIFIIGIMYHVCGMVYKNFYPERIQNDINDLKNAVNYITILDKYDLGEYEKCPRKAWFAKMISVQVSAKKAEQLENRYKIVEELNDWFSKNNWKQKNKDYGPAYYNDRYIIEIVIAKNSKTNKLLSLYISHNDFWEKYNL